MDKVDIDTSVSHAAAVALAERLGITDVFTFDLNIGILKLL